MTTDGCTGIPWRTPYEHCCDQHDLAYELELENGAPWRAKLAADWVLRRCIRAAGDPFQAWFVWLALVTVGWGYWGWLEMKKLKSNRRIAMSDVYKEVEDKAEGLWAKYKAPFIACAAGLVLGIVLGLLV